MKTELSPKELGAAIGVSESSLKRWADNGRLQVARTAGGHRRIHLQEAVRFVREQGFHLERPDMLGLEIESNTSASADQDDPAAAFHTALVAGDGARARAIGVNAYLEGMPLALVVDRYIAPAMRAIGERWRHDENGILIEHRAAHICSQTIERIRGLATSDGEQPCAVGGAPPDDPYVLPSLMAASVLATEGWDDCNLSAHTPIPVLAQAAAEANARLVWLALSAERNLNAIRRLLEDLENALAQRGVEAAIVIGGPALSERSGLSREGVYHARSMNELAAFAQGLRSSAVPPGRAAQRTPTGTQPS